jgi:ankyrin repeat protein
MSREIEELEKSKKHLSLLREEYVKLQNKYCELEKKFNLLNASKGVIDDNNFVSRLMRTVANLFDKELYCDLIIKLNGSSIKAHKFVLSSRSDNWDANHLQHISELDLTDIESDVGIHVIKWVYTDSIDFDNKNEEFILEVMRIAKRFVLNNLVEVCEKALMSFVNVLNCVKFYQTADEIGAINLKNHCSELVSNHWNDFTSNDFVHMSAPLLFQMFKSKTEYPLHTAIRIKREDVLFLYLIEFDSQLVIKLNEIDTLGDLPLDLALKTKQEDIAKTLVSHKANVSATDNKGRTLLHRAIERDDEFSAQFLIKNNASINVADSLGDVPLHLCADKVDSEGMARIAKLLLESGADPNLQDLNGNSGDLTFSRFHVILNDKFCSKYCYFHSALHRSIISMNKLVFSILLGHPKISLELRNKNHETSFAIALNKLNENQFFATELVKRGSSLDAINPETSDSLLHICARNGNENAGLFLTTNGAQIFPNNRGETALHIGIY